MKTRKAILQTSLVMLLGLCSISSVFASSYSAGFTMSHMIVTKQSMYLEGKKTVSGSINITERESDKIYDAKLTAELVQPQFLGYKICHTTSAGYLYLGNRNFNFGLIEYSGDTYYLALEQGTGFDVTGNLTVYW